MPADSAKFIKPSGSYYVLGTPGLDGALPPTAAVERDLVWNEDLLTLHVAVYRKPTGDGFITFDFPPRHVVEPDNPARAVPSPRPPDQKMQLMFGGQDYPTPPPGAYVWPAPRLAAATFLAADSQHNLQPGTTHATVQQRWWADFPFTRGIRLCFHVPSGIDDLIAIASAGQPDNTRLLDWSSCSLCLPPWGLSNASFRRTPVPAATQQPRGLPMANYGIAASRRLYTTPTIDMAFDDERVVFVIENDPGDVPHHPHPLPPILEFPTLEQNRICTASDSSVTTVIHGQTVADDSWPHA